MSNGYRSPADTRRSKPGKARTASDPYSRDSRGSGSHHRASSSIHERYTPPQGPRTRFDDGSRDDNPLFNLLDSDRRPRPRPRPRSPPGRNDEDLLTGLRRYSAQEDELPRRDSRGPPTKPKAHRPASPAAWQPVRKEPKEPELHIKNAHLAAPQGPSQGRRATQLPPKADVAPQTTETKVTHSVLLTPNEPVYSAKPAVTKALSIRGVSSTSIQIKNLASGTTKTDILTIIATEIQAEVKPEDCHIFAVRGGQSAVAEIKFADRKTALKAIDTFDGVQADGLVLEVSLLLDAPDYEAVRNMSGVSGTTHVGGGASGKW